MSKTYKFKFLIQNLPWTVGTKQLKFYFIRFGEIQSAWVEYDVKTGLSKGVGYVCYTRHLKLRELEQVHELHGETLQITQV